MLLFKNLILLIFSNFKTMKFKTKQLFISILSSLTNFLFLKPFFLEKLDDILHLLTYPIFFILLIAELFNLSHYFYSLHRSLLIIIMLGLSLVNWSSFVIKAGINK
jgi:hypothetical protein